MINATYTTEIEVTKSPTAAFESIVNLSHWWVEEFVGEELKLNSEFILKLGEGHFSKNKVLEFLPDKKFIWVTTESFRTSDNFDWSGTKMIFALAPTTKGTRITFTYDGVVLESDKDKLKEICDYCIKDLLYKSLESFTTIIEIANSPEEVFNCITAVTKWWSKDFEGNSRQLNDEFVIHHPNQHYSKQRLIEVVPDKKIVWQVTDSTLYWLKKDQHEWINTKMIFDISTNDKKTVLQFTHEDLVPDKECYAMCEKGWTLVIKDWLFYYITNGTASPEMAKAAEIREQSLKEKGKKLEIKLYRLDPK